MSKTNEPYPVSIPIEGGQPVSGLLQAPPHAKACYVIAHGAGAGMSHPFMAAIAQLLAARDVATLRFQFPYMERGSKRPDSPDVAQAAVRAAVAEAARLLPELALVSGGKSFGGRMSSQARPRRPCPACAGSFFSASRCILPGGRRISAGSTWRT